MPITGWEPEGIFKLEQQIPEVTCLWDGCERSVFMHIPKTARTSGCRDDKPDLLISCNGWTEGAEDCWYCPEHPVFEGKGWLRKGRYVTWEGHHWSVEAEVVYLRPGVDEVDIDVRGDVRTVSPDELSPA